MRALLILICLVLSTTVASAGKQTFDLMRFDPPAPYKKLPWVKAVVKGQHQGYSVVDQAAKTYCQVGVFQSTASKGDLDTEFRSEWKQLTRDYAGVTEPTVTDPRELDGWKIVAGVASYDSNGKPTFLMLTTFTGYGRTTSIVAMTTSEDYFPWIERFMASISLIKPATATTAAKTPAKTPEPKGGKAPIAEQYMEYNTMLKTWVWKWRYPKAK